MWIAHWDASVPWDEQVMVMWLILPLIAIAVVALTLAAPGCAERARQKRVRGGKPR